jgi:hypothetical protein
VQIKLPAHSLLLRQNPQTRLVRPFVTGFVIVIRSIAPVLPVAVTLIPYAIRIWGVEDSNLRRLSQQIYSVPGLPHTSLYGVILGDFTPYRGIIQQILTYFELYRVTAS